MYARLQLAKHSLLPSAAFQDTAVWTGSSGAEMTISPPSLARYETCTPQKSPGMPKALPGT